VRAGADLAQRPRERAARLHPHAQEVEQGGQLATDLPGTPCRTAGEPEVGREEAGDGKAPEERDGQAAGRGCRESSAGERAQGGGSELGGHHVTRLEARRPPGGGDAGVEVAWRRGGAEGRAGFDEQPEDGRGAVAA
jgi:hypothetical protein